MEKQYFKEYYELERKHWFFRVRTNILRQLVKKYTRDKRIPLSILNIGVATGGTTTLLEEFGTVTSVEYDKECCDFLNNVAGIKTINGSILDLPFAEKTYDLVCAFDVIEHVEDDGLAVREMKRVTKDGGIIMVTVPAFKFLWSEHDEVNHHFRRYTKAQLTSLFSRSGLQLVFESYFNFFLFFPIAIYRVLFSKLLRSHKQKRSDFGGVNSSKFFSFLLYKIFNAEKSILKSISLPVGVSIALVSKKPL